MRKRHKDRQIRKKIRQKKKKNPKTTTKKSQSGIGVDGELYTAPPASGMEEAGSTSEQI